MVTMRGRTERPHHVLEELCAIYCVVRNDVRIVYMMPNFWLRDVRGGVPNGKNTDQAQLRSWVRENNMAIGDTVRLARVKHG